MLCTIIFSMADMVQDLHHFLLVLIQLYFQTFTRSKKDFLLGLYFFFSKYPSSCCFDMLLNLCETLAISEHRPIPNLN